MTQTSEVVRGRLVEEALNVAGELAAVLEQEAVRGVGVDLHARVWDQPSEQVRVVGEDHRIGVAIRDEDGLFDGAEPLQQRVVGFTPLAYGVVLALARLPARWLIGLRAREDPVQRL